MGQALLGVGAVLRPWSENAISGPESAAAVLDRAGVAVTVAFGFVAVMAVALEVWPAARWFVARPVRGWRTVAPAGGLVCALCTVAAALGFAVTIRSNTVRAYVVDVAGDLSEPLADSRPGPGLWCAALLGLAALAVHSGLLMTARPPN